VLMTPRYGGVPCPSLIDVSACTGSGALTSCLPSAASTPCVVSAWSEWDQCTAPCGGGQQRRSRLIVGLGSGPTTVCPSIVQAQSCNALSCFFSSPITSSVLVSPTPLSEFNGTHRCIVRGRGHDSFVSFKLLRCRDAAPSRLLWRWLASLSLFAFIGDCFGFF
jgi:hypothetical protein